MGYESDVEFQERRRHLVPVIAEQTTMPTVGKEDEPLTPAQMAINAVKVFFALSPLLALFYVLLSGFESDDKEKAKRIKKGFSLDGHAE